MPKIEYGHDDKGIVLPDGAPFDGEPVLIRLDGGWVEAVWVPSDPYYDHEGNKDDRGFMWSCMGGDFPEPLESALEWVPLPVSVFDVCMWAEFGAQNVTCDKCGASWKDREKKPPQECVNSSLWKGEVSVEVKENGVSNEMLCVWDTDGSAGSECGKCGVKWAENQMSRPIACKDW